MKDQISIPEIDFEYKLWKNRLDFYEKELTIYRNRILAVKTENSLLVNDYLDEIKALILKICALKKEIVFHEEEIGCFKRDYPINREHDHYKIRIELKDNLNVLATEYHTLLQNINDNLSSQIFV